MFRVGVTVTISVLLIFSLQGQYPGKKPAYQALYERAERLFSSETANETTDSIALADYREVIKLLQSLPENKIMLADSYLKSGILLMSAQDPGTAISYFRLDISTINENQLPDSLLFRPFLYAGSIHYELNHPDSALYFYKKAEAVKDRYNGLDEEERLYNKFGVLYYETGDYGKSINYFEKALALVKKTNPANTYFIVNYQNNIAAARIKLGQYEEAVKIFSSLLPYNIATDQVLHNLANAYIEENNFRAALESLFQIRNSGIEQYNSITKAYLRNNQADSASIYLQKASLEMSRQGSRVSKLDAGLYYKNQADYQMLLHHYDEAVADYHQSILQLDPAFTEPSVYGNPASFFGLQSFSMLFDALVGKAAAFNKLDSVLPGQHHEEHSLNSYISALALAAHIEKTYFSDDARLFLKSRVGPATQDAVSVALKMYRASGKEQYLETAFGFVENNKASVLQAGIQHLEISAIPGIPTALLSAEKNYASRIAKLNIQYGTVQDSAGQIDLQSRIHELELGLDSIQNKLDDNPVYHGLRFSSRNIGMDTLQSGFLPKNTVMLSYYYTRDSLLCFYISGKETGLSSVAWDRGLAEAIAKLRTDLETPGASSGNSIRRQAEFLYNRLFSPVLQKVRGNKKMIIIPYNEIGYIPFEMLQGDKDETLLLNNFDISYNYSANFLSNDKNQIKSEYTVLGMAPFSEGNNSQLILPALPSSGNEISDLPGRQLKGAEATRSRFEQQSGQFPVIHLATHAVANDIDPLGSYIEFYGLKNDPDSVHRLYEKEIYNLDMKNVGLVMLSACETGDGRVVNGEGIISLSRAFSYAGCKSVVTSLWKADDYSTAFIMKRIHYYLQRGYAKDAALRRAKLDYIDNSNIEDQYKTPAYWAHLVLVGDTLPLASVSVPWYLWVAIPVIIVLIFIITIKKRNRA